MNMSSGGALVVSEHEIKLGTRVTVNIEWPLLLEGGIPLQLVTLGRVVRCIGVSLALSFERYQFRVIRSPTLDYGHSNSVIPRR